MTDYIKEINNIYIEIKQIKSSECILDYDSKTEIINIKMKAIASLENINTMIVSGQWDGVVKS